MSVSTSLSYAELSQAPVLDTSLSGMIRGEFLKIARLFWVLVSILTVGFLLEFVLQSQTSGLKDDVVHAPLNFFYLEIENHLAVFRVLVGILLIILTSFMLGREYQYGTIRILLARGVGRVQLLLVKVLTLALLAVALLIAFTLLIAILTCIEVLTLTGSLSALGALTPAFLSNTGLDLIAVLISMGATILMAAAANAVTRSLTVGLSIALIWFPVDNIGSLVLNILREVTHNTFWANVSGYVLGPLLNRLPTLLLPAKVQSGFEAIGSSPLVPVSAAHALWVVFAYALFFLIVAVVSTRQRDVKE